MCRVLVALTLAAASLPAVTVGQITEPTAQRRIQAADRDAITLVAPPVDSRTIRDELLRLAGLARVPMVIEVRPSPVTGPAERFTGDPRQAGSMRRFGDMTFGEVLTLILNQAPGCEPVELGGVVYVRPRGTGTRATFLDDRIPAFEMEKGTIRDAVGGLLGLFDPKSPPGWIDVPCPVGVEGITALRETRFSLAIENVSVQEVLGRLVLALGGRVALAVEYSSEAADRSSATITMRAFDGCGEALPARVAR